VFVWPTITQNVGLVTYTDQGIDVPATINSNVTGPQGYAEAFMYQLALRLCGPMMRPVTQSLADMATAAYARMKRPNEEPSVLGVDAALIPWHGGSFNVLSGQSSGPGGSQ